jgi:hypothetical protein
MFYEIIKQDFYYNMSSYRDSNLESKIKLASEGHYYIKVVKNNDKFTYTHVSIKGNQKMWEKDNDFIYVPKLRHAGRYDILLEYFVSKNYDEEKTKEYLNESYTIDNYQSLDQQIKTEIAKIPENNKIKQSRCADLSSSSIISLGKSLKEYDFDEKIKPSSPIPVTPRASAIGGKRDLKMRLEKIRDDEVLNITTFNSKTKKGIKKMKKPYKQSTKAPVSNIGDLKRLYYDFSHPVENGIEALVFLGFKRDKAEKIMNDPVHTSSVDPSSLTINH